MPAKKKNNNKKIAAGLGIGVALAAAAAAVYAFSGENGKKRRAKVSKWARNMKDEAIKEMRAAKVTSKKAYHKLIDELGEKYSKLKDVNARDVAHLANELKSHWDKINSASKKVKKTPKTAKRKTTAKKKK
ncbi:MAG: hypothetical protein Q8Q32_03160 [bacterium]|nr:hypothetical protein [bacterium]